MIKALKLIFVPVKEWEKTANANHGVMWVLFTYLVPLLAICSAVEGYGLQNFGEKRSEFGEVARLSLDTIIRYEAVSVALLLVVAFVGAYLILTVSRSFQVPVTFSQAFMAVGYAIGPLALVKILDAHPIINTWLCWAIGMFLVTSMLYHSVAVCLKPEQTKGFGIYVFSTVFIGLLSGLSHFIAIMVLHGKLLKVAAPL